MKKKKDIHYPVDITPQLQTEIQYEFYKLNWQADLLALDRKLSQNDANSINHISKCKELIGCVLNKNSTGTILFPNKVADYFNVCNAM